GVHRGYSMVCGLWVALHDRSYIADTNSSTRFIYISAIKNNNLLGAFDVPSGRRALLESSTMGYQVLARKWRPRSFSTLVGQEHVVRALTHALETGRLHHAWLFTGTRGV